MQQTWDVSRYSGNGRFVALLAEPLVESLNPQAGERILDLGCGDGFLTLRIAESGAKLVGVDSSPHMIAAARERGVDAHCISGETLPFEQEFHAVLSNAALHWMSDQDAVLEGVYRALKPGGRFVAEFGGQGNIAAIRVALMAVLGARGIPREKIENNSFFSPGDYRARLEFHGFQVEDIALIPRPTPLPSGMAAWLETFRSSVLELLPPAERQVAVDEIVGLLKPVLCDRQGHWTADYVRLRFLARKP
ncbi:MAG TPA: methyltransferase domain-containing protein [Acidobacteriaceae bacterium]|nr:methyltransferase domain-containing protein [Acidobacteriaceae bacterium]